VALALTDAERAGLGGAHGPATALAFRLVTETAAWLGAARLVPIVSSHIDGALYHGDSGTYFAEKLAAEGGRVAVPATLNVGGLDLIHPGRVTYDAHRAGMARRMMDAYVALGCRPSWTCAPYQFGHRPAKGEHVAWGESNAICFVNSVLGARSHRYGDFLDIACALAGRAPHVGLHRDENRRATVFVDAGGLSERLKRAPEFYPVLGTWLGGAIGGAVAVIEGLPADTGEDALKALGAAAASSGGVGLFHVAGVTPEAPTAAAALGGTAPDATIRLAPDMLRRARDRLSTATGDRLDAVALGSPHFSEAEFRALEALLPARRFAVPFYVCTAREQVARLEREGRRPALDAAGVILVADTCVVVAPILPAGGGVLMTNSGKFAHYTPATTGYEVVFGSLEDCVASAAAGRVVRDEALWA
jgi:hypothetical protein